MKVILEGQLLCDKYMRGISYYSKSLINTLIRRGKNDYALTIFDYERERGNRGKVSAHLESEDTSIYECNTLDYRDLLDKEQPFAAGKTYQEYTGAYGDVYHFMTQHVLPPGFGDNAVVTVHDMIVYMHPEWFVSERSRSCVSITWDRICKQRPFIITDSQSTKNDVLNENSSLSDRIFIVPLSYQESELYPDKQTGKLPQLGITHPYILFFGAMELRKGIGNLVSAFNIVAQKHDDVELVMVGGKYENDLETALESSRYKPRIKWLGTVDDATRRILYSCAEVFVFPSLYEGFGLPVLEAMACGAPVITSNISSLPEVAGDAAILVDPADVEQLAYEIERVLMFETLRKDMIAKGFENCKSFSWDKTADLTERVYEIAYEAGK